MPWGLLSFKQINTRDRNKLFLLYINNLPKMIQYVQMVLYADDINILIIDKDENKLAEKTTLLMKCLESWFNENS
jgi:hypothetical protein